MTNGNHPNRKSPRASWWDYTTAADYFVTICSKNRTHFFGKIENGKMQLSHAGIIADVFWYEIKNHFPMVELFAFVVMPNHIHGIIRLLPSEQQSSLSTIVGSYKSAVTKHCNRLSLPHEWQTRFYDNIIRSEQDFERIENYIRNNPANWPTDKFHN